MIVNLCGVLCGVFIAAALQPACTSEPAATPACDPGLEGLLTADGVLPPATEPLLPPPEVYPDDTLPPLEGVAIDPRPLARGDHPMDRYWLDPEACEAVGGRYPWGPPVADGGEPADRQIGETSQPTWRLRALVVTGADLGAPGDAAAWDSALAALGAVGRHLHRPTAAQVREAIAEDLCADLDEDTSVLLVGAGRGTPAGGGALLLDDEAILWSTLLGDVRARCAGAGLRLLVFDGSWLGADVVPAKPDPPTVVIRATDDHVFDAPRLAPNRGGLLTAALTELVRERAAAQCLGLLPSQSEPDALRTVHPTPEELVRVFSRDDLVDRMLERRWEAVGEPALSARDAGLGAAPTLRGQLAATLAEGVPTEPWRSSLSLPAGGRCNDDADCDAAFAGCGLAPCNGFVCRGGTCRLELTPGAPCNDGNDCTTGETCTAAGECRGDLRECDDGDACTLDECLFGEGCVHLPAPDGGPCDDGDACTEDDACDGGVCSGEGVDCDDHDPCTTDTCDPVDGCETTLNKAPCDDGNACTILDFCFGGDCRGQAKPCQDGEPCTLDGCDPLSGDCEFLARQDGTPCDDGDLCTIGDVCTAGACGGQATPCDDGLDCTLDLCEGGQCEHLPAPGTCATGAGCVAVGDNPPDAPCLLCQSTNVLVADDGGPCEDDGVACTADYCAGGECVHVNAPGTCTTASGDCVQVGEPIAPCLVCAATGVAAAAGVSEPCDDGNPCTGDDACTVEGGCEGVGLACCPVVGGSPTCGGSVGGDTSGPGTPSVVTTWDCLPGGLFNAPESAHTFAAPCAGPIQFTLAAPSGMVMFIVRGEPDACGTGSCQTYTGGPIVQSFEEGEPITLVVDGQNGVAGPYTIDVECPCVDQL